MYTRVRASIELYCARQGFEHSPNLNRKERKDRYAKTARATHPLETYETKYETKNTRSPCVPCVPVFAFFAVKIGVPVLLLLKILPSAV